MAIQYKRGIQKMIYARAVSTLADDDDTARSILLPVESIVGFFGQISTNYALLTFRQLYQYAPTDTLNTGYIMMTCATGGQAQIAQALAEEINNGEKAVIVLGDNHTSELFSNVTGIGVISNDVTDD